MNSHPHNKPLLISLKKSALDARLKLLSTLTVDTEKDVIIEIICNKLDPNDFKKICEAIVSLPIPIQLKISREAEDIKKITSNTVSPGTYLKYMAQELQAATLAVKDYFVLLTQKKTNPISRLSLNLKFQELKQLVNETDTLVFEGQTIDYHIKSFVSAMIYDIFTHLPLVEFDWDIDDYSTQGFNQLISLFSTKPTALRRMKIVAPNFPQECCGKEMIKLLHYLKDNQQLQILELTGFNFAHEHLSQTLATFITTSSLEILNLGHDESIPSYNHFDKKSLALLLSGIKQSKNLSYLAITKPNGFLDECSNETEQNEALVEGTNNTNISLPFTSYCNCPTCFDEMLDGTEGQFIMEGLSEYLLTPECQLKSLKTSAIASEQSFTILLNIIINNTSLQALSIDNDIYAARSAAFIAALKKNKNLRSVYVKNIYMTEDVYAIFNEFLATRREDFNSNNFNISSKSGKVKIVKATKSESDADSKEETNLLPVMPNSSSYSLDCTSLRAEDYLKFFYNLYKSDKVTELYLYNVLKDVTRSGRASLYTPLTNLLQSLLKLSQLKMLTMTGMVLERSNFVKSVQKFLIDSKISSLVLGDIINQGVSEHVKVCIINELDYEDLISGFSQSNTLTSLELNLVPKYSTSTKLTRFSKENETEFVFTKLKSYLASPKCILKKLHCSAFIKSVHGIQILGLVLEKNTSLKHLDLRNVHINPTTFKDFFDGLSKNKSLEFLRLGSCELSPDQVEEYYKFRDPNNATTLVKVQSEIIVTLKPGAELKLPAPFKTSYKNVTEKKKAKTTNDIVQVEAAKSESDNAAERKTEIVEPIVVPIQQSVNLPSPKIVQTKPDIPKPKKTKQYVRQQKLIMPEPDITDEQLSAVEYALRIDKVLNEAKQIVQSLHELEKMIAGPLQEWADNPNKRAADLFIKWSDKHSKIIKAIAKLQSEMALIQSADHNEVEELYNQAMRLQVGTLAEIKLNHHYTNIQQSLETDTKKLIHSASNKITDGEIKTKLMQRQLQREAEQKALEEAKERSLAEAKIKKDQWAQQQQLKKLEKLEKQKQLVEAKMSTPLVPATQVVVAKNEIEWRRKHHNKQHKLLSHAFNNLIKMKHVCVGIEADEKMNATHTTKMDPVILSIKHYALLYQLFRIFLALQLYQQNCHSNESNTISQEMATDLRNMIIHHGAVQTNFAMVYQTAQTLCGKDQLPESLMNMRKQSLMERVLNEEQIADLISLYDFVDKDLALSRFRLAPFDLHVTDTPLYKALAKFHSERTTNNLDRTDIFRYLSQDLIPSIFSTLASIEKRYPYGISSATAEDFYDHYYQHYDALKMMLTICGEYAQGLEATKYSDINNLKSLAEKFGQLAASQASIFFQFIANCQDVRNKTGHTIPDASYEYLLEILKPARKLTSLSADIPFLWKEKIAPKHCVSPKVTASSATYTAGDNCLSVQSEVKESEISLTTKKIQLKASALVYVPAQTLFKSAPAHTSEKSEQKEVDLAAFFAKSISNGFNQFIEQFFKLARTTQFQIQHKSPQLISLYNAQSPLLIGQMPDTKLSLLFDEFDVRADGNCGFYALGINRQEAVSILLSMMDTFEHRRTLGEEILHELMAGTLAGAETSQSVILRNKYEEFQKQENDLNQIINHTHGFDLKLKLNHSLQTIRAKLDAYLYQQILPYSQSKEMFKSYVENSLGKNGFLGYCSALLLAKHKKYNLYIWKKKDDISGMIQCVRSNVEPLNTATIHILHTHGSTHYNLLAEANIPPTKENTPQKVALI